MDYKQVLQIGGVILISLFIAPWLGTIFKCIIYILFVFFCIGLVAAFYLYITGRINISKDGFVDPLTGDSRSCGR